MLLFAGFGWGRPVPVDPRSLRYGRLGMALVSAAGPLSNLGVAFLTLLGTFAVFTDRASIAASPIPFTFLIALAIVSTALSQTSTDY